MPSSARAPFAPDIGSIVEAAYRVDGSTQEWATGILGAAHRSLKAGPEGFSCELQLNPDGALTIDRGSAATIGQKIERASALLESLARAVSGFLERRAREESTVARCVLTSEMAPRLPLPHRKRLPPQAVSDELNIFCLDEDRRGFLLSLDIRDRRKVTPGIRDDLQRVATHILTALRLRRRLRVAEAAAARSPAVRALVCVSSAEPAPPSSGGEAALTEARRALQAAVLNLERALATLRAAEAPVIGEWKGPSATRWMLIHQIDAQGARYIVARQPTLTTAADLSSLTPTERRVVVDAARGLSTKEISFSHRIAETTVRVLIMRAARRLGVRTRDELLTLARTVVEVEASA